MLPVNLVFSGLVGEAFGLGLFVVALVLIRGRLPWTLVYFPLLLIPQMIFTVGHLLVSVRARRIPARSGAGQRISSDASVFRDADLLSDSRRCRPERARC